MFEMKKFFGGGAEKKEEDLALEKEKKAFEEFYEKIKDGDVKVIYSNSGTEREILSMPSLEEAIASRGEEEVLLKNKKNSQDEKMPVLDLVFGDWIDKEKTFGEKKEKVV